MRKRPSPRLRGKRSLERRAWLLAWVVVVAAFSPACRCAEGEAQDGARAVKLDGVTKESMSQAATTAGFKVREEDSKREELSGVATVRLTLDHRKRGTAFVDLYDFSSLQERDGKPAVRVGPTKTLFVRVLTGRPSSASLMTTLLAAAPLEHQTRETIETTFKGSGWTLGDSVKLEDDITGHEIVDVVASRDGADVLVELFDYAKVMSGTEQSAGAVDGERLLLVDTEQRRWSASLLQALVK